MTACVLQRVISSARLASIQRLAAEHGFDAVAALGVVEASARFRDWYAEYLKRRGHADLSYLEGAQRYNPRAILPDAQSLLLFRYPYRFPEVESKLRSAPYKIARYAWQKDYHVVLKAKLAAVMQAAGLSGRAITDSAPLAERYWARLAGLGKIGRNGMLIAGDAGSYFLIAAVLTPEPLAADFASGVAETDPAHDISEVCRDCRLCVDACPTEALTGDGLMITQRCISYQTIEKRENEVDVALYKKRHRWVFGCDVCQQVCPYNKTQHSYALAQFSEEHPAAEKIAAGDLPQSRSSLKNSAFYRRGIAKLLGNLRSVAPVGE